MFFNIKIDDIDDLKGNDAGWVSGYFEIGDEDFHINCFKEGKCMIMLTIIDLIHLIRANKQDKILNWIGADNGKTVTILITRKEICFTNDKESISIDFKLFTNNLKESIRRFIGKCMSSNKDILKQSAFIDLNNSFDEFLLFEIS